MKKEVLHAKLRPGVWATIILLTLTTLGGVVFWVERGLLRYCDEQREAEAKLALSAWHQFALRTNSVLSFDAVGTGGIKLSYGGTSLDNSVLSVSNSNLAVSGYATFSHDVHIGGTLYVDKIVEKK